jgi:hypothetical protein
MPYKLYIIGLLVCPADAGESMMHHFVCQVILSKTVSRKNDDGNPVLPTV